MHLNTEPKKNIVIFYGSSLEEVTIFSPLDPHRDQRYIFISPKETFQTSHETTLWEVYHHPSEEILKRIAWETLFTSLHVVFSPQLTEKEREEGRRLIEHFRFLQRGAEALLSDVRDMGRKITGNIARNLPWLAKASAFSPFCESFRDIPAIICGAGPSLEDSLPFLHQLRQCALLLAGGSALNALSHASITPHFAAAIDPDPPLHLFREQSAVEAPLFYQNRVAHHLLKNCHSTAIFVPDNISYPIEEWLMDSLKVEAPPFEAGWNIATFCLHIAVAMGCNPIVLTGIDLCQAEDKAYAMGVSMPKKPATLLHLSAGKMTKPDFLLAAEWIEEFIANHPEITFINTSMCGLPLRGVEQMDPKNLILSLSRVDLEGKVHSLLQKGRTLFPGPTKITAVLERFKENINYCFTTIEKMVGLLQTWYPDDPSKKGEFVLLEVESEENPIYTYLLQPLWNIWQWVLLKPVQNEPYQGFTHRIQKLLFFQEALQELREELADAW